MSQTNKSTASEKTAGDRTVACILVNYCSPWGMLKDCLESIRKVGIEPGVNVILVDNASGDGVIDQVRSDFPEVAVIEMPSNAGFAAAVNRGIDSADEQFVLLLNTDALLTEGSVAKMVARLETAGDDVAGLAPKMMSSSHTGVIDAIGTVMPRWGAAYNRGIGQCDLGQYDDSEEVAGVCFGAALLRRRLFEPEAIGPLYEDYFLYFEDADWCMRAVSLGYRFITAPDAQVLHLHSGVTRYKSLEFKYRLIELNTLKMVTRTFGSNRGAARIVAARTYRLLARTFIRRRFVRANLATIFTYLSILPRLLAERRQLKSRRIISDQGIFSMAEGEHAYFDTVDYRPDRCLESLIDSYTRKLQQSHDPKFGKLLEVLYRLRLDEVNGCSQALTKEQSELFTSEPACVKSMLQSVTPADQAGN